MVEQEYSLDEIFGSLSDATRRDILKRVSASSMSIGAIASYYPFSFAGVAKHIDVLERAGLVHKDRQGKEQLVTIDPAAFAIADAFLASYKQLWEQRLNSLDTYLQSLHQERGHNDRQEN